MFYRAFTVGEHLELVGAAHGVIEALGRRAWARRVGDLLDEFGLAAHRDARPDELSAGLRQRTHLACAFARPFTVLAFDEPTLRLDPGGQELVARRIGDAVADGAAALVTSHSADFVNAVADEVVILENGSVAAAGAWAELKDSSAARRLGLTT